jgi:hypothetical protein
MKLIKLSLNRYLLEESNVTLEGNLDLIMDRLVSEGILSAEELEEALIDMGSRGTNVAMFGQYVKEAMAGRKTYGFMYSMKVAA